VFKKRPNFLNSAPVSTEGTLRPAAWSAQAHQAAGFDNKLPFARKWQFVVKICR